MEGPEARGAAVSGITTVAMTDRDFCRLSEFIHGQCGIKLTPVKKVMLESRLAKRLKALGIASYREYCDHLFDTRGMQDELIHMIDVVTTNKTDFFREPAHFRYLSERAIPALMETHGAGLRRPLNVWSAGCSTGEEPYTLAMVLSEIRETTPAFNSFILATDISTRVLEIAARAVYQDEKVAPMSAAMRRKYLLRGRKGNEGHVRIVPELRSMVAFRRLNFMDGDFGFREVMDVIFCRNVIIYFDRPTQERLLRRFCDHLVPGGFLFMGHSETLNGMDLPLVNVAPTVYRKRS